VHVLLRLKADCGYENLIGRDFDALLISSLAIEIIKGFLDADKEVDVIGRLRLVNHRGYMRWVRGNIRGVGAHLLCACSQKFEENVVLLAFDVLSNGSKYDFCVNLRLWVV